MNDFYQPLAQFDLCDPTAVALEKQPRNHRGLSQHDGKSRNDQPLVLVPQTRLAKAKLAIWRQLGLADPPPRQLPPIENRLGIAAECHGDIASTLAVKDAQRDPRCITTD